MVDLPNEQLARIRAVLEHEIPHAKVFAFGSRVRGNAARWSDVDLAVDTGHRLTIPELGALREAFSESDVDGIVRLYAADTTFLGTGSKAVVVKPEEIRRYFEQALLNNRPRGAKLDSYSATVLSDTAVLFTGLDTVTGVRDGAPFSANGRVTFVVAKRGADWQIVHFHRSAMPR